MKLTNYLPDSATSHLESAYFRAVQPIHNRIQYRRRLQSVPKLKLEETDVVVVVIDCLREDHVSGQGYHRETTPVLDSFGTAAAVAPASWTYSSVPSILSGHYPRHHGAAYKQSFRNQDMSNPPRTIRDDVYTLPELLDNAGHETFFASAIATAELPIRGRVRTSQIHHRAPSSEMVEHFRDWWETTESPRFAYLHLGDLHEPIHVPEIQPFGAVSDDPQVRRWRFTQTTESTEEFEHYRMERMRLYDTALRFVDEQIREITDIIDHDAGLEDAIVAVTGDHGEEFWEWSALERERFSDPRNTYGVGHGHALVPEVVRVPLTFAGGQAPSVPTTRVSAVDIAPTVLEALGSPRSVVDSRDGLSLFNPTDASRPLLSEEIAYGHNQIAVIRGNKHLIYQPHNEETILIDTDKREVISDVTETRDLCEFARGARTFGDSVDIGGETESRLEDLGYL